MSADGPDDYLFGQTAVLRYFDTIPMKEVNFAHRRSFLMFLHGLNAPMPTAEAIIGPRSVIKCFGMPYFDRSVMEYIHGISRDSTKDMTI